MPFAALQAVTCNLLTGSAGCEEPHFGVPAMHNANARLLCCLLGYVNFQSGLWVYSKPLTVHSMVATKHIEGKLGCAYPRHVPMSGDYCWQGVPLWSMKSAGWPA